MRKHAAFLLGLVLATPVFGQSLKTFRTPDSPRSSSADVSPIAKAAHVSGKVTARVTVENGSVVKTDVISKLDPAGQRFLEAATVGNLETWRFDVGITSMLTVTYTYEIVGTETEEPSNPAVEISPSLDVTIKARPVKPTVNY